MSSRQYVGYEWNHGDVVAIHILTVTEYTEHISFSWFHERNMRLIDKTGWQQLRRFDFDPLYMFERQEKEFPVYDKEPRFTHNNIWDFYKAIGYNYKKKRYI